MKREEVQELHYIAPIENVASIVELGILSHNRVAKVRHNSVAMAEIQAMRTNKAIPGTRRHLHDYVNLYFDAHNPMLSRVRNHNNRICVLQVDSSVLDLPEVIVTDQNAASKYVQWLPASRGLAVLNRERLFAEFWLHPQNQFDEWRHKSEKCAEVLVPDCVPPRYILGAYVPNQTALEAWERLTVNWTARVKPAIFF